MQVHDTPTADDALTLKEQLIRDAEQFCSEFGISKARLGTVVAKHGGFFDRIEGGGGLTTDMLERFYRHFAERRAARDAVKAAVVDNEARTAGNV